MNSASSRREINVFLKQNNDFDEQNIIDSMKSLKNSMNSASSRWEIDVSL